MPEQAIRILCMVMSVMLSFGAEAAEQSHATAKAVVQQPSPAPNQSQSHASAQPVKFLYRDVCDKHPNLKQCS